MSMQNRNRRVARAALCFGLVAAMASPVAGIARPDDHAKARDHGGWREGYYRRPDVYYSAPPVINPPYGYYQAPGATLSLSIPIR